jgi:hypothetical protein
MVNKEAFKPGTLLTWTSRNRFTSTRTVEFIEVLDAVCPYVIRVRDLNGETFLTTIHQVKVQ